MLLSQARDLNLSQSSRQDGASRFAFQKLTTAQTLARATESLVRLWSILFSSTFIHSPCGAAVQRPNMKLCCFPRAYFIVHLQIPLHVKASRTSAKEVWQQSDKGVINSPSIFYFFSPRSTEAHQRRSARLDREVVLVPGCQRGAQAAADSSLRHQQSRRGERRRREAGKGLLQEHREDGLRHPPEGPGHCPGCGC